MAAALLVVPGHRRRVAVDRPARAARRGAAAAGRRRGDGRGRRWPGRCSSGSPRRPTGPWVSGTSDNSIWSLILGYNGLGRLFGQAGGPGGGGGPAAAAAAASFGGEPGVLRLLNESLGGQAGWLLGFALVGGLAVLALDAPAPRRRAHGLADRRRRRRSLTTAVAFSARRGHLPPLLRLPARAVHRRAGRRGRRGARSRRAARDRRAGDPARRRRRRARRAARQRRPRSWLPPVLAAAGVGAAVLLASDVRQAPRSRGHVAAVIGAAAARARRAGRSQTLGHATSGTFPAGGPATTAFGRGGGTPFGGDTLDRSPTRSPTRRRTAAARSPSPASPARPASSSPTAPTSPPSAASPAARARSASSGSPRRSRTGGSGTS